MRWLLIALLLGALGMIGFAYPFNTQLEVANLENGRRIQVRVNDRGPFKYNRILDLSRKAAEALGMLQAGTAHVRLKALNEVWVEDGGVSRYPFSVQVALFKQSANAGKLERRLKLSRIEPWYSGEKKFYRVLVGKFDRYRQAVRKRNSLRKSGHSSAFIIQEP